MSAELIAGMSMSQRYCGEIYDHFHKRINSDRFENWVSATKGHEASRQRNESNERWSCVQSEI